MTTPEQFTAHFYAWELLGRGWVSFDMPIDSEPAFVPFFGHQPLGGTAVSREDDGYHPTLLESLVRYLKKIQKKKSEQLPLSNPYISAPYTPTDCGETTTLEVIFPLGGKYASSAIQELIRGIAMSPIPVVIDIVGDGEGIHWYFSAPDYHLWWLKDQIEVRFPHITTWEITESVFTNFDPLTSTLTTEYGLAQEFMRPLHADGLLSEQIITAFESCNKGELMVFQVMMQGVINPWGPSINRSVSDGAGGSFFSNAPEMLSLAREKTKNPLLSVCIRSLVQSSQTGRTPFLHNLMHRTILSTHTTSNALIALDTTSFTDVIERQTRRWGMILNSREVEHVMGFPTLFAGRLFMSRQHSVPTPSALLGNSLVLGINEHLGKQEEVSVNIQQRLRHTHVIGATGTGKSTLLLNMMIQDIEQNRGFLLLDPHGDVVDMLLNYIPLERIDDVIIIDPSDIQHPVGINLFQAQTEVERIILSSDLLGIFRSYATSWGDTMDAILGNAIDVMLQHPETKTLVDLRFFLSNPAVRKETLKAISDPYLLHFWQHEFTVMRKNAVSPLTTRLDTFLRTKIIRGMMSQTTGISFSGALYQNKIVLVKLAQGLIGEANSYLLGSLITTKLYQSALARQGIETKDRSPYFLYIDEFQHFLTPSTESMLSGARKFGLGLVLAHQTLSQITDRKLLQSILTNVGIRVCMRVGEGDATKLEQGFAHFERSDLINLSVGQAIIKVGRSDHDCLIRTKKLSLSINRNSEEIITQSREKHSGSHVEDIPYVIVEENDEPQQEPISKPAPLKPVSEVIKEEKQPSSFQEEAKAFKEKEQERLTIREHRRIQELIRKQAHAFQLKAVIEHPVDNPAGRVDVALFGDHFSIACEVSVTTPPSYEFKNIQKGLSNDFSLVAMCSSSPSHLLAIEKLAQEQLSVPELEKVFFGTVQEFFMLLDKLTQKQPPTTKRTEGYRVKVNYTPVDTGSTQQRMDAIVRAIIKKSS